MFSSKITSQIITLTLPVFLLLFNPTPSFGQDSWDLKKDKNGIQVSTKKVEGSNYKAFKGETELEVPAAAVVAIIIDFPSYPKWSYMTKHAEILEKKNDKEIIGYVQSDAPWPVTDRDGVYQLNFSQHPTTKTIKITAVAQPDYIPAKDGYIRVPSTKGFWEITPLGPNKCKVLYQNHSEPGGSIPSWLANSSVINIPFNTLTEMKKFVVAPKYQNQSLDFLKD